MSGRPEREETERENWRKSHATVQPPRDIKDRIREAREHLFKIPRSKIESRYSRHPLRPCMGSRSLRRVR